MKKIFIFLLSVIAFAARSQTLYIPSNPDSLKLPINVNNAVRSIYLTDLTKTRVNKAYYGKTFAALGDSYTQMNLYQPTVSALTGITITSNGVGGSCIAGGTELAEGDAVSRPSLTSRINTVLASNPDGIIIEGGTNDWYYSTPIGDINTTDTTTFIGAYKYILQQCLAKTYPIFIAPVTPIPRGGNRKSSSLGSGRVNYPAQKMYTDAIIQVCALYGVPVCNEFDGSGITYENIGVYTSDNVHPNAIGVSRYAQFIASFIQNPFTVASSPSAYKNPEAQIYFNRAGITDPTFRTAYDQFVTAAKGHSYFTKLRALYPLPASALQNSYDAISYTAKASFTSTVTHSATGVTFNGTNYMDLGVAPNVAGQDSLTFFAYAMTDYIGSNVSLMGSRASSTQQSYFFSNSTSQWWMTNNSTNNVSVAYATVRTGLFGSVRTSSTSVAFYQNSTLLGTLTDASTAPSTLNFFAGGYNNSGFSSANAWSGKIGLTGVGSGFTATDWTNFYTDVKIFLKTIAR